MGGLARSNLGYLRNRARTWSSRASILPTAAEAPCSELARTAVPEHPVESRNRGHTLQVARARSNHTGMPFGAGPATATMPRAPSEAAECPELADNLIAAVAAVGHGLVDQVLVVCREHPVDAGDTVERRSVP